MSKRQDTILNTLKRQSATTYALARELGAPEASVRRDIQRLREQGHCIEYVDGYATLREGVAAGAGVAGGAGF